MPKATRIERECDPSTPRKLLDRQLGYALLCDRRVPLRFKVGAFAIGYVVVAVLGIIEFPFEEIIAVIPFLGILGDVAVDGLEVLYVPYLLACLLLPYLAPSTVVDQIRRERDPDARSPEGPIIDV